jgi:hypothetical protein
LFKEAVKNKVRQSITGYDEPLPPDHPALIAKQDSLKHNLGWNLELPP